MNSSVLENKLTPMMEQYFMIKNDHKDCLLLYRMGDFYELFYEDALIAAPILGVVLTKRGKNENQDIPMCGIPHHSSSNYIKKLIDNGHKVAICDQLESPEEAKKRGAKSVVKREVVRIITPGTITEDNLLNQTTSNYLASIAISGDDISLAYADISTLEFSVVSLDTAHLSPYLARINPSEILVQDSLLSNKRAKEVTENFKDKLVTFADTFFDINKTTKKLLDNFSLHSKDSLRELNKLQISSCGSLIEYISITQKKERIILSFPRVKHDNEYMIIDRTAQSNLELLSSKSEIDYSLFKVIDRTASSPGSRLLKRYLAFPSVKIDTIKGKLSLVKSFIENKNTQENISNILKSTPDIQRSLSKLAIGRGSPNDLYAIHQALINANLIADLLKNIQNSKIEKLFHSLTCNKRVNLLLQESLIPRDLYLNQNDFINHSYNNDLSKLYNFRANIKDLLETLKNEYKQKTGIHSLKIEYNNVIGYYIEITKSHLDKITSDEFIHKQTMLNCSRYVTEKLKDLENKILNINDEIAQLESRIFKEISDEIVSYHESLSQTAQSLAFIDVMCSFAIIATEKDYCEPEITSDLSFNIVEGRHPVVEYSLAKNKNEKFVSNDCNLSDKQNIWLITGPNMAGKSTFLRQNALIAILAHIGSYVPAKKAQIGIVDRIFSRIGSGDDLAQGHSTFLVEMIETAAILNQATERSLIILDEIGRGTSTYDGMAIAFSCLEHIHDKICARTLFSTHYHELIKLSEHLPTVCFYTVSVKEWENKIIFMHKVIQGIANKSYGINVAQLAGIPNSVIARSKEILLSLDKGSPKTSNHTSHNLNLFDIPPSSKKEEKIVSEIKKIKIDELTAKQALDILYRLKEDCEA